MHFNDLLPLPWTRATLDRVCAHVDRVQSRIGRSLRLENPATYLEFEASIFSEAQFLCVLLWLRGCKLLLDISKVQVSCVNHRQDPQAYLDQLPADRVGQIHLAGFAAAQDLGGAALLIDDHGSAVGSTVWQLYGNWIAQCGEGFAAFNTGFSPASGLADLPDIARLEHARTQAFHAADAPVLTAADATPALMLRPALTAHVIALTPGASAFTHTLWRQADLASAAAYVARADPRLDLAATLSLLLLQGALTGVQHPITT